MTLDDLVEIGLFPSKQSASRRMRKLGIKRIGTIGLNNGRPKDLYFGKKLSAYMMEHEYAVSRFLMKYPFPAIRGNEVDPELRPDATIWIEEEPYHIELDRGTETTKKVMARMSSYIRTEALVMIVCLSIRRMESLYERFDKMYSYLMFSVLAEVMENPFGDIWRTWDEGGNRVVLGVDKPLINHVNNHPQETEKCRKIKEKHGETEAH